VLQVRGGAALEFYSPLTEQWLGRDGSPRTYTVVFEEGDQPSDLNIRLYYPDLALRYFADAIQIRVSGDPSFIPSGGGIAVLASLTGSGYSRQASTGGRPVTISTSTAPRTPPIQRPADSRCWSARVNESQKASRPSATFVTAWMVGGSCDDLRRKTPEEPRAVGE
jgi:hypothetical protein